MKEQTKKILEELYVLDPKLKEKEVELIKIVEKLLATKPNVQIDDNFIIRLRHELLNNQIRVRPSLTSYFAFLSKKPVYITGSIFAVMVLAMTIGYFGFSDKALPVLNGTPSIVSTDSNSFGSLAGLFQETLQNESAPRDMLGIGAGGGGGLAAAPMMEYAEDRRSTGMIAPSYKQYQFKYTGGAFEIDAGEMSVFKRIKGHSASTGLVGSIYGQVKSMINLSSLSGMKVENIRMTQGANDGYSVTLNLQEGVVNIEKMTGGYAAQEMDNSPYKQVAVSEMPSNEEIVKIANSFFNEFGINIDGYGTPYVNEAWKENSVYSGAVREVEYISPVISVVYPISIEGNETYDQDGTKRGLQVNVNINGKYVQNVWNLTTEKYESSKYQITDDNERIVKLAEGGGSYPGYYGESPEIVTLNLGQPELIYVLQHKYDNSNGLNEELYIPAFKFPILNMPDQGYYGRRAIIIPVVEEILDQHNGDSNGGRTVPMPMMEPMIEPMFLEGVVEGDGDTAEEVQAIEVE